MSLALRSVAVSDVGLIRSNNEDSVHAGRRLLVVADGIGGLPDGELASDIVVRTLTKLEDAADDVDPVTALREAIEQANREVRDTAATDRAHEGMGTTVTALLLSGDRLGLLHVGDSRGYRYRDGALTQLTRDDTYVQSLVDQGVLTTEAARRHPQRSLVTRAVQGQHLRPSTETLTPCGDDRFLLCSDGLSDFVTDEAIAQVLQAHPDPQQCAEALVKLTVQAGAPDNVTVIVADVVSDEAPVS
jgi:protein phosphatase